MKKILFALALMPFFVLAADNCVRARLHCENGTATLTMTHPLLAEPVVKYFLIPDSTEKLKKGVDAHVALVQMGLSRRQASGYSHQRTLYDFGFRRKKHD